MSNAATRECVISWATGRSLAVCAARDDTPFGDEAEFDYAVTSPAFFNVA